MTAADPGLFAVPDGAAATRWVDGLQCKDATVLLQYRHPHFGRWPAVTTRTVGKGRITYVGTVPNPALAEAVLRWASPNRTAWQDLPTSVTCTSATSADGRRLRFLHNWSWDGSVVTAPVDCRDVLSDKPVPAGGDIELTAWDVRVFDEGSPAHP